MPKPGVWQVYVLECEGGFLYTGISNDPEKRFKKHVGGKGAAFMRLHPPKRLLSVEIVGDYALALRREAQIKRQPRAAKHRYFKDPSCLPFPKPGAAWFKPRAKKKK